MCAIFGILHEGGRPVDAHVLRDMASRLRHRGPDGQGFFVDKTVGLGHDRLAIIDPKGGHQPLFNEDESVWVTFNGEIYNYRELTATLESAGHHFRTKSDSEVLVHAFEEWGIDCLQRLRGMFAFAIWDVRKRKLFLARDRVGIKPLVYTSDVGRFAFASEIQALHALPDWEPTVDPQALDLYLHFQYIPAPFTIHQEVRKLPPAHYLEVDEAGRLRGPVRYWNLEFQPDYQLKEQEWVERLHTELEETIRLHLVSDVPFGAFLSGGLDSSTVVAYMSQLLEQPVRTFSIGFDQEEYDETQYARQVARQFETEHHQEYVRPDALEVLSKLVRHYGEPFADSSALPTYYVSQLAASHVKMVLSGDGGDENFAGYSTYAHLAQRHRGPRGVYRRMRYGLGSIARAAGLRPKLPTPGDTWYESIAYFNPKLRAQLWRPDFHDLLDNTRCWFDDQSGRLPHNELRTRFQHLDINTYLPYDILAKVDIASMCHGLEVRVPLLDHVLMETVAEIPPDLKLRQSAANGTDHLLRAGADRGWIGKYILKRNAQRFFSPDFLNRPKRGFGVPIDSWFAGEQRPALEHALGEALPLLDDYFDVQVIKRLVREHGAGCDHAWRLWALLFLGEWLGQQSKRPAATLA